MVDVSTTLTLAAGDDEAECHRDRHALLCDLEADSSLFVRDRLRQRSTALDDLDAAFGGSTDCFRGALSPLHLRAHALRIRLEAANQQLYRSIRSDIVGGGQAAALLRWLDEPTNELRSTLSGFGFDYRDELVSGVLQLPEPSEPNRQTSPEMVPYQPTPVRHILHLIADAAITEEDVFVDIGSGLGHVPLLVSVMTGAKSIGVEVEAGYVASAHECAQGLHLNRVQFIARDARDADLSGGSVFYLYTPFTGAILTDVLSSLRREGMRRAIKVCSLGPCTQRISNEPWLKASASPHMDRIAVFESR